VLCALLHTGRAQNASLGPVPTNPWRTSDCSFASPSGAVYTPCFDCSNFTAPNYGTAATFDASAGKPYCPFDEGSKICSATCYFFRPIAGNNILCPTSACDNAITTYCCTGGNCAAGPTTADLGCMVFTRPPIFNWETVGVLYLDWLSDNPTGPNEGDRALNTSQTPYKFVEDSTMRGGASTTQMTVSIGGTIGNQDQFRADMALALDIPTNWIYIPTEGASSSVVVQVLGYKPSTAGIEFPATWGGVSVSAISATDKPRTNDCYGSEPRDPCEGPDPAVTRWPKSRVKMSGVFSCQNDLMSLKPECYINADSIMGAILVAVMFGLTLLIVFLVTWCTHTTW